MKYASLLVILAALIITSLNTSCKKPLIYSKGNLAFSKDTVVFDTVFTTIGSTTQQLKIYNTANRTVLIDEVELMGGGNSPFRVNLDGLSGTNFSGIELEGGDSLFLFVEVTLDPNGGNLPMVVEDRIRFRTNGTDQFVQLAAWGQDVYYHYSVLSGNGPVDVNSGTWPNDKPHLIYGAAFVDEGDQLTIPAGTQIYMHKNSFLYVYKGTLNIEGTLGNEVVIQGDRLESDYDDVSGQFYGVYLDSALSSTINYAIIKNGTTGIHIEGDGPNGSNPTVTVTNTIIENCARYGIMNFYGAAVKAENCLIYKNGFHAFINLAGRGFEFNHCHLLGYGTGDEQLPAIGISDFYTSSAGTATIDVNGIIRNSVIYGNQESEIAFNLDNNGSNTFEVRNCLIKRDPAGTDPFYVGNMLWNLDPQFKDIAENDFEFWSASPLQGAADSSFPTTSGTDIKGIVRGGQPDIGAYEL